MWEELTPSAINALRTAKARDNESRLAVEGSSGVPTAYATTLKLMLSPVGAAWTACLMASALAGLRSACPVPKVTRSPASVVVATVVALSEIGGGGGGGGGAAGGSAAGGGGATGARATGPGGATGSVAGGGAGCGAAVAVDGDGAVTVGGAAAGRSVTCR
jgi:hypothetical protein